jgi:hypothetical protein
MFSRDFEKERKIERKKEAQKELLAVASPIKI